MADSDKPHIEIGPDGSPIITTKVPSDSGVEKPPLPVNPNPVTPFSPSVTPTPTSGTPNKVPPPTTQLKPSLPKMAEFPIKSLSHDKLIQIRSVLTTQGMDSQQAEKALLQIKSILEK